MNPPISTMNSTNTTINTLFPNIDENYLYQINEVEEKLRIRTKIKHEYQSLDSLPAYLEAKMKPKNTSVIPKKQHNRINLDQMDNSTIKMITDSSKEEKSLVKSSSRSNEHINIGALDRKVYAHKKPEWHAPWKLMRVISGHLGWVRCVCVEPDNQWFATGSADKTIKIWDLASGRLRVTLTGHVLTVRDIAVSSRHPYMFSAGDDRMVKCWDLETNTVIRHYHGHLSSVYTLALHPTLDLLITGGRDSSARVWDMRTREAVHVLTGHKASVSSVKCQEYDPQVITSSMDATVRLWDLAAGKTETVLTHHKKAVRDLALHPTEFTFASASADNIKEWKFPDGDFMHNFYPSNDNIVNTISVNQDGVLFSGGDNGSIGLYDWSTGSKFQELKTIPLPGSLEAEQGILTSTFDKSGIRLITGEADKSIKIWKEDPDATSRTHPGLDWHAPMVNAY